MERWTPTSEIRLLELYHESWMKYYDKERPAESHKGVYDRVLQQLNESGVTVTRKQLRDKMSGLKRTGKKIIHRYIHPMIVAEAQEKPSDVCVDDPPSHTAQEEHAPAVDWVKLDQKVKWGPIRRFWELFHSHPWLEERGVTIDVADYPGLRLRFSSSTSAGCGSAVGELESGTANASDDDSSENIASTALDCTAGEPEYVFNSYVESTSNKYERNNVASAVCSNAVGELEYVLSPAMANSSNDEGCDNFTGAGCSNAVGEPEHILISATTSVSDDDGSRDDDDGDDNDIITIDPTDIHAKKRKNDDGYNSSSAKKRAQAPYTDSPPTPAQSRVADEERFMSLTLYSDFVQRQNESFMAFQANLAHQQQEYEARMAERERESRDAERRRNMDQIAELQRSNQQFHKTMAESMMTFQANLMKSLFKYKG